jgi:ABC-2 type transport system ATP-binding protein
MQNEFPAVEVHDLVKHYPKSRASAVDGINFVVEQGEIFGLLGPNGAGKSTTIGVLTTRIVPTSGYARIRGIDVTVDPMNIKQRIAVVPQQVNLDRSLQAREILTYHAAYHGVRRNTRDEMADALLNDFGLADRGKEKISPFSGGLAQRLMIARALMHAPDVLFLDEPTQALDPQSRLFLWDRIRALHSEGTTIFLTTHDMVEAEQLCERIAIMDHGKVLVVDTSDALKRLIPGGTKLELRIRTTALPAGGNAEVPLELLASLEALPTASNVEVASPPPGVSGRLIRVYASDAASLVGPATHAVEASGAELLDLRFAQPSLEDVFIFLTGRSLR